MVGLDPQQRSDSRQQLGLVERLLDKVVGAGFQRADLLLVAAGGDHDHRQKVGGRLGAQPTTHLKAVHAWHDHVEQHEVWRLCRDLVQRRGARGHPADGVTSGSEACLHHLDIARGVVDHQDPGLALHGYPSWSSSLI